MICGVLGRIFSVSAEDKVRRLMVGTLEQCTWHDVLPVTVARALRQLGAQLEAPADQLGLDVLHDQVDGHLHQRQRQQQ